MWRTRYSTRSGPYEEEHMDFILSYNNREGVLVFPVVPSDGISRSVAQQVPTFDGVRGQLQAIGCVELATFEISSIFPNKHYPWLRPGSTEDGWSYVETIETVRRRRIPFRAVLLDNAGREVFNLPVTIPSFSYGLDRAGDIAYTISFLEYRFANLAVQGGGS